MDASLACGPEHSGLPSRVATCPISWVVACATILREHQRSVLHPPVDARPARLVICPAPLSQQDIHELAPDVRHAGHLVRGLSGTSGVQPLTFAVDHCPAGDCKAICREGVNLYQAQGGDCPAHGLSSRT